MIQWPSRLQITLHIRENYWQERISFPDQSSTKSLESLLGQMSQCQILSVHRGCNQSHYGRGSDDLRVSFSYSQLFFLNAKRLQSWRSKCPFTLPKSEDFSRSGLKLNCPKLFLKQCFRRQESRREATPCENVDARTYRLWLKSKYFCVRQTITQLDRALFSHLQVLGQDTVSRPIVPYKVTIVFILLTLPLWESIEGMEEFVQFLFVCFRNHSAQFFLWCI